MLTQAVIESKIKTNSRKFSHWPTILLAAVVFLSACIALFASFGLREWAETSALYHSIQHVLLFTAGIGAGIALTTLFKRKKD